MNAVHLHLLLNHLPVIGIPLIGVVLAWGIVTKQGAVQKSALGFLVLLAIATIPVYLTGEPAEEAVEGLAGVSEAALERHEEFALWGFAAAEAVGLLALVALIAARRRSVVPPRLAAGALGVTILAVGLLAWTGYLGGQIRHEEIRSGGARAGEVERDH